MICITSILVINPLQAAPRRNFAFLYRLGQRVAVDTRREADSVRIYLRFPESTVLPPERALYIAFWSSFDAKRPMRLDSVRQSAWRIRRAETATWVEFCLPVARLVPGQVVQVSSSPVSKDEAVENSAWLQVTPETLGRTFVLTDSAGSPLLRRYVRVQEPFLLDTYGPDQPIAAKRYTATFGAALPPMTDPKTQPAPPPTLGVQDTLAFRAGQLLVLSTAGLYNLRTADGTSTGLLVEDSSFPALTSAAELIQPLIYLTTSAERKKLYDAPEPKRAVDRFWLDLAAGQQSVAKLLIRTYYGRVAEANQLFSAHKDGWMTDRGMLYVVLGPPDVVYRSAGEEQWMYRNVEVSGGTYVFRSKPSTFAAEHYELVRRPEYELLWYAAVEQWRKGLIAQTSR
ncbi:GWxTD domain-containing protein [Hymenobacter jejuensis]|uniref:GWxTD domain-containing protein n=1 Tax=Hymenobacter jejuensis TaxID=2502781 RepID=UPI0013FCF78D|nr:GWxTD domain-containing protein [Hymenobacter jejuensis]